MRNTLMLSVVLAVLVAVPTATEASLTIKLTRTAGQYSGNGGEFDAYYNGTYKEQTFCLEIGQHIVPGHTYDVHSIYENSITGSNGGQSVDPVYGPLMSDPLSGETAWLFLEFDKEVNKLQTGALNYLTGTRSVNAGLLQNAIWRFEGESVNVVGNAYYTAAMNASVSDKNAALAKVRAVNPIEAGSDGTVAGNHVQSMLTVIPEPLSLAVWGGLIAVAGLRRGSRNFRV